MSNAPEGQKPQTQKSEYSNQSSASKTGNNTRKNESSAKSGKDNMENEGGRNSTSGDKSSKA